MRVALLAAGAAGMVCGSCLRDNRLAATLREQGRDVSLIPLYTPIRTDEIDASARRVYFGGINVFLQQKAGFFRGLPRFLDRLLDADWLLRRLRGPGRIDPRTLGELTVSVLRGEHGLQRKEVERLADALARGRFDVVNLPNLMFAGVAAHLRRRLGVPVVCTLSGEDIFLDNLAEPYRARSFELIRRAAADIDSYVALTDYYARHAAGHFGLPRERVETVRMGVRVGDFAAAAPQPAPFTIGYLARICPDKGLEQLVEAFILLRSAGRACRLRVAGWMSASDAGYLARVRDRLEHAGLASQAEFLGEVTRAQKLDLLRSLHVLCVPAPYPEAKGLYVLEALAAGVPVVLPDHGSFRELVSGTGGGLLFPPGDAEAAAAALARVLDEPGLRGELAQRGRAAVQQQHTDETMARSMWALYERVARAGKRP